MASIYSGKNCVLYYFQAYVLLYTLLLRLICTFLYIHAFLKGTKLYYHIGVPSKLTTHRLLS